MSQGRHFQVVASKTPECVYKVLEEYTMGGETYEGIEIKKQLFCVSKQKR